MAPETHVLIIVDCKAISATEEFIPKPQPLLKEVTTPAPKAFWVYKPIISKQEMEAVNCGGMEPSVDWKKIKEI